MPRFPVLAILVAAVSLGAVNLFLRSRGVRKPILIGSHLLLGLGALEAVVYLLKDSNGADGAPSGNYGNIAAGFLALAAFSGLLSPILGRRSQGAANALLTSHVSCGLAGFLSALAWLYSL
jgi:hypothetical protein